MKTVLKIFAGIIVLLIIALAVFLYTFDANRYKQEIITVAEALSGRSMTIDGDIDISLYPWIGIKLHDLTIENPAGFSNTRFAEIGQFDVRVKMLPLLQKRLDIDKLVLHQLKVDFEKNLSGDNNWADISDAADNDNAQPGFGLAGFSVGGIDVTDSNISLLDGTTGKRYNISRLSLSTKAINEGQPLPVKLKAFVQSSQPRWQAAVNGKSLLEFSDDAAVVDAKDIKLAIRAMLPDTEIEQVTAAMVADGSINLQTQSARFNNTRIGAFGLVMSGTFDVENILSVPVIQGPVNIKTFEAGDLAKYFDVVMPQLTNAQSLKQISLSGLLKADFDTLHLSNISANVDESKVSGLVHVTGISQPVIRYKLKADMIRLDDYMIVDKGPEQDEASFPLDFIRGVDLEGVLDVDTAVVDDVELKNVHIASNIENAVLRSNPVTMLFNEGEVKAAVQLDASETPVVMLTVEARQLDAASSVAPLLKNIIGEKAPTVSGRIDADANLSAKGTSMAALRKSVQGNIKINMDKATIKGIDFDYASQSVVVDYAERNDYRVSRTFNQEYVPDSATEFDSMAATFRISNGKLINDDLLLVSDKVNVTGSGSIDYINGKLDYRPVIDMNMKSTVNVRDKLRDHPMQYHAHGLLGDLTYDFNAKMYDLHMGRLMIQEAKAHKNRRLNSQSQGAWKNVLSN